MKVKILQQFLERSKQEEKELEICDLGNIFVEISECTNHCRRDDGSTQVRICP